MRHYLHYLLIWIHHNLSGYQQCLGIHVYRYSHSCIKYKSKNKSSELFHQMHPNFLWGIILPYRVWLMERRKKQSIQHINFEYSQIYKYSITKKGNKPCQKSCNHSFSSDIAPCLCIKNIALSSWIEHA